MDDDFLDEDLGSPSVAEGIFTGFVVEAAETFAEDRDGRQVKVPSGVTVTAFFAALAYAIAKKATGFGPFAALGTDTFLVAKYLARGMFVGFATLAKSQRLPGPFRYLLRSTGPLGRGIVDGTLDRARRGVIAELTKWSRLPNPEQAMGPALRVCQGIVEFNAAKLGLGGATPSDGASKVAEEKNNNVTISHAATVSSRKGESMFIGTHLNSLERQAVVAGDDIAQANAAFLRGALERYRSVHPTEAAAIIDASSRGLVDHLEIANLLAIGDEFTVFVNGVSVPARHARLNELAALARKKLDEIDAAAKAAVTPPVAAKAGESLPKGPIAKAFAVAEEILGVDEATVAEHAEDPDLGPRRIREAWEAKINAGPGPLERALKAIWAAIKTAALWLWSFCWGRFSAWRTARAAMIAPPSAPAADPPVVTGPSSVPPPPPDSIPPPPPNTSSP